MRCRRRRKSKQGGAAGATKVKQTPATACRIRRQGLKLSMICFAQYFRVEERYLINANDVAIQPPYFNCCTRAISSLMLAHVVVGGWRTRARSAMASRPPLLCLPFPRRAVPHLPVPAVPPKSASGGVQACHSPGGTADTTMVASSV
eukprot:gene5185-biopygen11673